jgi:hypothetical protein
MEDVGALIAEARAAGLTLVREGDSLVMQGPRASELIVDRVRSHKAEVLAALEAERDRLLATAADRREEWADAVRELGEALGFPCLPCRAGHSIAAGNSSWMKFSRSASIPNLQLAVSAIRASVNQIVKPQRAA